MADNKIIANKCSAADIHLSELLITENIPEAVKILFHIDPKTPLSKNALQGYFKLLICIQVPQKEKLIAQYLSELLERGYVEFVNYFTQELKSYIKENPSKGLIKLYTLLATEVLASVVTDIEKIRALALKKFAQNQSTAFQRKMKFFKDSGEFLHEYVLTGYVSVCTDQESDNTTCRARRNIINYSKTSQVNEFWSDYLGDMHLYLFEHNPRKILKKYGGNMQAAKEDYQWGEKQMRTFKNFLALYSGK